MGWGGGDEAALARLFPPDYEQHLGQTQTAIAQQQQLNQKQQSEANAVMAREQAETTAAANTDRAAELASGGAPADQHARRCA